MHLNFGGEKGSERWTVGALPVPDSHKCEMTMKAMLSVMGIVIYEKNNDDD